MTPVSEVNDKKLSPSRLALVASFALPIIDVAAILLIRTITSPENRTTVLGLYAFFFPIACIYVLFYLLLSKRRPIGHLIAYVSLAGLTALFNYGLFVFARSWERTFESM